VVDFGGATLAPIKLPCYSEKESKGFRGMGRGVIAVKMDWLIFRRWLGSVGKGESPNSTGTWIGGQNSGKHSFILSSESMKEEGRASIWKKGSSENMNSERKERKKKKVHRARTKSNFPRRIVTRRKGSRSREKNLGKKGIGRAIQIKEGESAYSKSKPKLCRLATPIQGPTGRKRETGENHKKKRPGRTENSKSHQVEDRLPRRNSIS